MVLEAARAINRFIDGLVHQEAAADSVIAARHRLFIGNALSAGLFGVIGVPAYLAIGGQPTGTALLVFAWLAAQAPIGLFLSRVGHLTAAHLLNAFALTMMIVLIALQTGGLSSPAMLGLVLLPAEAALHGARRVIAYVLSIAVCGLLAVFVLAPTGGQMPGVYVTAGIVAIALAYGALVAVRVETLSKRVYEQTRSAEARYRLVAENITDIVLVIDAEGDVRTATPSVRSILATEPADLLGTGLFRRIHVTDRPAYLTALSNTRAASQSSIVDFRVRAGDAEENSGRFIWLEMRCDAILDAHSGVGDGRVVAVLRDVTRRKQQEEELRCAHESAENANQTKTRFLASVSHELRTPLNAIIGFSELLQSDVAGKLENERHVEYVQLIHESGEHLLQVVNDILDMSKIESGNFKIMPEAFNLPLLLKNCRQMTIPQAENGEIKVVCRPDPRVPEFHADPRACRQIMINLLSNAIKFSKPGDRVQLGSRLTDRGVVLYVEDTGIGIAEDDIPMLGHAFFQADSGYDRRSEGTGLGLSMVKGLAELHGGTMQVESRLGEGTRVEVCLPIKGDVVSIDARKPAAQSIGTDIEPKKRQASLGG